MVLYIIGVASKVFAMNGLYRKKRILVVSLCVSLIFVLFGPVDLLPKVEAASQASLTRLVKKLKRQVKKLKRQLAVARRPAPEPVPFIEMVPVGNAGNGPDPGNTSEALAYGAVPYEFQIGKYEVNLEQYAAFLNAVASTDTYALYYPSMGTNLNIAGIERSGADGSYTYAVIGSGKKPVTYVSWFDCARFCNWLHNGRPIGAQDASTTERGAYMLDGATSGVGFSRALVSRYWIPSEDEWYKAAYHQPSGQSGDTDSYWEFPTGSNTIPGNEIGTTVNQANFYDGSDYSVTQSGSLDSNQNYLTDGGAYEGSPGFYGTFDQGGNVWEWNDAVISGSFRGLRGGSWSDFELILRSSTRFDIIPGLENFDVGFRVASP